MSICNQNGRESKGGHKRPKKMLDGRKDDVITLINVGGESRMAR